MIKILVKHFIYSPNSVSTLKGSYGDCKGRCLIRVLQLIRGILPANFCMKWLLRNVQIHFDSRFWDRAFVLQISA
jgi:hypothetical protein